MLAFLGHTVCRTSEGRCSHCTTTQISLRTKAAGPRPDKLQPPAFPHLRNRQRFLGELTNVAPAPGTTSMRGGISHACVLAPSSLDLCGLRVCMSLCCRTPATSAVSRWGMTTVSLTERASDGRVSPKVGALVSFQVSRDLDRDRGHLRCESRAAATSLGLASSHTKLPPGRVFVASGT